MKTILCLFLSFLFVSCIQPPSRVVSLPSVQADSRPQKPDCMPHKMYSDLVYAKRDWERAKKIPPRIYTVEIDGRKYTRSDYSKRNRAVGEARQKIEHIEINLTSYCSREEISQVEAY